MPPPLPTSEQYVKILFALRYVCGLHDRYNYRLLLFITQRVQRGIEKKLYTRKRWLHTQKSKEPKQWFYSCDVW